MAEAYRLPAGNKRRGADDNLFQQQRQPVGLINPLREVVANHVLGQLLHPFRLAPIVEMFKMAETNVAFCNANHHRAALGGFAINGSVAGYDAERPGRRDPERMHRLAGQTFPQSGPQDRAPIPHA